MKTCPKCGNSYTDGAVTFCPRDGEVLEESAEDMTGRVLDGQYEIESFIARGGMGTLYRARHILLGDRVAIKTLKPEMRSNSEWLRRFQREGRAARRFRHPNAVTVYDLRTGADGLTYMVMEYVEGHSLDKELKERGRLTPAEAWQILEPITSALEAAHAQGVVHRDLKPENVMLNRTSAGELQVKLLDLGIAKLRDVAETQAGDGAGAALTVAGQILGTPYYMSPEQWGELSRDANPEIDGRADIYSLGVIFYELITGEKPFVGYSLAELRQGHVSRQLPSLDKVASGVSAEFARAVEHAMAKDRADRPATAGVFAAEIRAALGVAPDLRANANRSDSAVAQAAVVVVPDFESSQTLIRENINATNVPSAGLETAPQKSAPQASAAAVAQQAVAHTPKQTPLAHVPVYTPTRQRSSGAKWIAVGVLVLLLFVVVGAGGWFAWSRLQARSENRDVVSGSTGGSMTPARAELLDYWLEAFDDADQPAGQRVAAKVLSLGSGQQFKFHFKARERGFLYIVGPGAGNAPTTFLTARPAGIMKTNLAAAGADFIFPYGAGQVLELDKNSGTEEYVVIYSRTPLLEPAFLAASAGHELTPEELKELEDLRARSKTAAPVTDVKESGASSAESAAVTVFVSQSAAEASGQPVVFDIRIEHR
jgi:serine/threonine protein kinase